MSEQLSPESIFEANQAADEPIISEVARRMPKYIDPEMMRDALRALRATGYEVVKRG